MPVSRPLTAAAVAACVFALPAGAAAQTPAAQSAQRTLTVIVTGEVKVERPQTLTDATIAAAIAKARAELAPATIAKARAEAVRLGYAANLDVLGLLSVGDVQPSQFGPFGTYGLDGTFGPGRYCGTVRTRIRRRVNGVLRPTGRTRSRRTCRVPGVASRTITATYEVTPKA